MNSFQRSTSKKNTRTLGSLFSPGQSAARASAMHRKNMAGSGFPLTALVSAMILACAGNAFAAPTGGVVTAGGANIGSQGSNTTITQSTANVVINWQSFNIGKTEAVQFIQPSTSSVALNRVVGADPSSILGSLSANGSVFLVNPNGILFGQGSQVNVGGLVASTLNITDTSFMAGNYRFAGSGKVSLLNQGDIRTNADGGYVALLGGNVSNEGVISARLGTVALASGNAITLDLAGDGLLNVAIDQGAVHALVQNGGLIQADGGRVLLTTQAAGTLLQSVVNNTGIIRAQSIGNRNGVISLLGDAQSGTVGISGTLDVSGASAGETGGTVLASAQHVALLDHAAINASGTTGGGTVLIGGNLHGSGATLANASATYMSADSTIAADASGQGKGGEVVLWSNNSTRAYGSISARGGAAGGDGGLIETSAHWLDVAGINANANSAIGKAGVWLLDPADVTITSSTANGSFDNNSPDVFSPDPSTNTANVNGTTITTALNTGTSVEITTANASGLGNGDITVGVAMTWTAPVLNPATLTLTAVRDVNVNAAITATNGSLVAVAGRDANVNAAVTTTNGSLTTTANGAVNLNAGITTVNGGTNINVTAAITTTTGNIILRADNNGTGPGVSGGTVNFTGAGTATLNTGTASIYYDPADYSAPTDYSPDFTGTGIVNSYMWVYAQGVDKAYDGTRTAAVTLKSNPSTTISVVNPLFDTADVGLNKLITFDNYSLSSAAYALWAPFGPLVGAGTAHANITPASLTVTASNASKSYGQTPTLSLFTTTGLANAETVGSVTETSTGAQATASVLGSPYVITASNAIGGTFNPANYTIAYVDGALTVNPASLAITASNASKTFGQTPSLSLFTSTGLANGETVGSVTELSTGTLATASVLGSPYAITASNATGGTFVPSNYTISYLDGALTVNAANLAITASNASKTFGQTPSLSLFSSTGLANGDTVGSVSETSTGALATANVLGSPYAITASNATGGTFVPTNYVISYVNGALTVNPALLAITASNASKTYGQTPSLSLFTTSGLVNGNTVGSVTETSSGTLATANVLGSPYAITASNATGGTFVPSNYTISYLDGALTVNAANLAITASNTSKTYGQTPSLSLFTSTGLANGETVGSVTETSAGTLVTANVLGSPYAITASNATGGTFVPTNYVISYVNGALTVNPAGLAITASNASKTYGQTPSLSLFTSTGLANGDTVGSVTETSSGTLATASVLGSPYAITASNATGGTFVPTNYVISYVNGALTVNPAGLAISASNASKTFGQTPSLSLFTSTGLANGDTVGSVTETSTGTLATANVSGSPYAITASNATGGTFVPTNYVISYANGALTVNPALLAITASNVSKTYGQTPSLSLFTTSGLVNGNTVGSVTETSAGTLATANVQGSPYAITASNASGGTFVPTNYIISYINGALTVTPAGLAITAGNVSKVFGQSPALSQFTTNGLLNGDTVTGVTETSPGTLATANVVGSPYAITPANAQGSFIATNYTVSYVNGALTVTPAPLTITASNVTKTFGQTPTLSLFTSSGLVNGDIVGSVTETSPGTLAGATAKDSPYVITPSNAIAASAPAGTVMVAGGAIAQAAPAAPLAGNGFDPANYTITYVNGVLTVLPLQRPAPVIVPPVPGNNPTGIETPGTVPYIPGVSRLVDAPVVELADPAQLLAFERPAAAPAPIVAPAPVVADPAPYVAPVRVHKQDRN
jgi:filamentous hemagglutinin family protein